MAKKIISAWIQQEIQFDDPDEYEKYVADLTQILGVDKDSASQIAINRDLPGLYGCKGSGDKFIYIINEAMFCKC